MKIGTIGAGHIAQAFTKHAVEAGFEVVMSNKSGPGTLAEVVSALGPRVRAGTLQETLAADLVLLSVPWAEVAAVLHAVPPWTGQLLLDTTNAISHPESIPLDLGSKTSTELVAELAPGARVVKAFNTLSAHLLAADPAVADGQRVIFISGDDKPAKATVLSFLAALGFAGIDLGGLATGGRLQQMGGSLALQNLVRFSR